MCVGIQMAECGQMHHCRPGGVWQGHSGSQPGAAEEYWQGGPLSADQHYQRKLKANKRVSNVGQQRILQVNTVHAMIDDYKLTTQLRLVNYNNMS